MTEAEELELLELEEEEAQSHAHAAAPSAPSAPSAPQVGAGETFFNRTASKLPLGKQLVNALSAIGMQHLKYVEGVGEPGARLTPQARAELSGDSSPEAVAALKADAAGNTMPGLMDSYRQLRGDFDTRTAAGADQNKKAALAGDVAGVGLSLLAPLPKVGIGGKAAGAGARILSNALTAGGYGAINGAANSRGDLLNGDVGQVASDAVGLDGLRKAGQDFSAGNYGRGALDVMGAGGVGGAITGGLLSAGMEGGGAVLKKAVSRLAKGFVKPSPDVKRLAELGVDTDQLTLGQMNPHGVMAQMEEAGQHALGSGGVIRAQREAGNQAWRDAALSKATAPYAPLSGSGSTPERLANAYENFGPVYDAIGEKAIKTAGAGEQSVADQLRKAFRGAAQDESVLATDAERAGVDRYLNNQASAARFNPGETNSVAELQAVRSNIRREIAQSLKGQGSGSNARLLKGAEQAVTEQIERNLPGDAREALRATDARYASHKTVEDAVRRAGDNTEGLMPQHLSAAVKSATQRGAYARGGGGDLRDLAALGREALQAKTPPTGVRALIQAFPGGHYLQGPVAALANTAAGKRFLLGQTESLPALASLLGGNAPGRSGQTASTLASLLSHQGGGQLSPALAALPPQQRDALLQYANALKEKP